MRGGETPSPFLPTPHPCPQTVYCEDPIQPSSTLERQSNAVRAVRKHLTPIMQVFWLPVVFGDSLIHSGASIGGPSGFDMNSPRVIPTTTTQLLNDLRDTANRQAWGLFDERYRPIIHAVAIRLGLRPEDAADVAQQTIADFIKDYQRGQYDRGKGRLRDWLKGIARTAPLT